MQKKDELATKKKKSPNYLDDELFDTEVEDVVEEKEDIDDTDNIEENIETKKYNEEEILEKKVFNKLEIEDLLAIKEKENEVETDDKDVSNSDELLDDTDASLYQKEDIEKYVAASNELADNKHSNKLIYIIIGIVVLLIFIFLLMKGCSKTEKYTIKFDTNGGNNINEQVIDKNKKVKEPEVPTREGYKFIGWYINDEEFNFDTKINKNTVIIAKWEKIEDIKVKGITLDQSEVTIGVGEKIQLVASIIPENAKDKSVTWSSSNTKVATVDANGNITGIKKGTSIITVTTNDGKLISNCKVIVSDNVIEAKEIVLSKSNVSLKVGDSLTLVATLKPKGATSKGFIWKSSDEKIATVDNKGVVKGIKNGNAVITVTTKDKKLKAEAKVTVSNISVTGVTLDTSSINLIVSDTFTFKATVKPNNAANKDVTWSSSNTKVATVDNNGKITALTVGDTVITVKTVDGGKKATAKVHVSKIDVTGVSLNKPNLTLDIGASDTLVAKITPEKATIKSVTWKSSNTKVATVDNNGKVTAMGSGKATITVTADGGKTATCAVTVNNPSIKFSKSKDTVYVDDEFTISYTVKPSNLKITWSSSKTNIGTINGGKFKALSAGSTNVTAKVTSNDASDTATMAITVENRVVINIKDSKKVSQWRYYVDSITLRGQTVKLTYDDIVILISGDSYQNHVVEKNNEKSKTYFGNNMCNSKLAKTFIYKGTQYTDVTVNC